MNLEGKSKTEPAQRLAIHAAKNGWTVDVDFCASQNFQGCALPQFVYTDIFELGRGVINLLQPPKPGEESGRAPTYTYPPALKQRDDRIIDLEDKLVDLRDAKTALQRLLEDSQDHLARVREQLDIQKGYVKNLNASFTEAAELCNQKGDRIKELESEISALNKQLCPPSRAEGSTEAFHRGYMTGIKAAQNEGSSLNLLSHASGFVEGRAKGRAEVIQAAKEMNANRRALFSESESPKIPVTAIQVGDVWRGTARIGNVPVVRCITGVDEARNSVEYHFTHNGNTILRTRALHRLVTILPEQKSSVTRRSFVPARLPGEPAEGFAVGDVWTKDGGATRAILAVSETEITYDYRHGADDDKEFVKAHKRKPHWWNDGSMEGATLTRK